MSIPYALRHNEVNPEWLACWKHAHGYGIETYRDLYVSPEGTTLRTPDPIITIEIAAPD